MKKRIISIIVLLSIVMGFTPVMAEAAELTDTTVTVTYTPEKYIYYYRNDYADTGGKKRMIVDTSGTYSAYSTYAFLAYEVPNADAVTGIDFSVYCSTFQDNRSGGTLYSEIMAEIPAILKGEYDETSEEYAQWTTYFNSYKSLYMLWDFRASSYPDISFKNVYNSAGELQSYKIYSGWLTRSLPEDIILSMNRTVRDDKSSVLSISNCRGGENVRPSFNTSEIHVTYDLTKVSNKSADNVMGFVNSVRNADEMMSCIYLFADVLDVNKNALRNISGVCDTLAQKVSEGTEFTADTFKSEYEAAVSEYIVTKDGISIDITTLTPEDFKADLAAFSGSNEDFSEIIDIYCFCLGIEREYIDDYNNLSEEAKESFITAFCADVNSSDDINKLFYLNLTKVFEGFSEYEDAARYSTDFESEWKFFKYFLNQLDLSDGELTAVKDLYDDGEYKEAVKEYRNFVLDNLRKTKLGEFGYHENSYTSREWGNFFAGVSGSFSMSSADRAVLYECNFQGSPYNPISPDWAKTVAFPEQAHTTDVSYFVCFNTLVAQYFETGDIIYLDKWMQIADVFCREHRRWYIENYGENDYSTNLCWNWKNAQSALNQADRILSIIKSLGAFAKLADNDKPETWTDVLEARAEITDRELYDTIDEVKFANIVISLIHDHSEAMVLRYVNEGATPNQRFSGLTALALTDRFFGDSFKFKNEYSYQTGAGLIDYAYGSFYPDGGMVEQAFNYNAGDLEKIDEIMSLFENAGNLPEYVNKLKENKDNAKKLHSSIAFPDGTTPVVGLGGTSAEFSKKPYTSIAFPYIGFYSMRNSWNDDGTNLFMQSPRRTSGHLYPSNNGIELYAKGRMLLMNGGAPWYAKNMAPSDQVSEYDAYNAYFGESSSYNRNTVIVDNNSQSKSEFNGIVGTPEIFNYPLNNMWHSSDNFDYVSADYDGGYSTDKASAVHNRQVTYIKTLDMFVVADTVTNNEEGINECSQIWNFMPYLTKAEDGADADGFPEEEVVYDNTARFIKTQDADGANVFLYNFYPEDLKYTKYFGYKGEEGYRGFYAMNFARRYPKVDMHVSWKEKGKSIPVLTLIETSENTASKITDVEDLSYSDPSGGYSGFKITTADDTVWCYSGNEAREYNIAGFEINAKSVIYEENSGRIIVTGAVGYAGKNFEGILQNGSVIINEEIGVPGGFEWNENGCPEYNMTSDIPVVSNAKITGNPYFGGTLKLDYDFSAEGTDDSVIAWYRSTDCKNWSLISGANKAEYTIERYIPARTPYYYRAAIMAKSGNTAGKTVYTEPTVLCKYFFDDFEDKTTGEIYSYGELNEDGKNFKVTVGAVTENENSFLRLHYSGVGRVNQKSNPYIRRFWKKADELISYRMRIRIHGEYSSSSFNFAGVVLAKFDNSKLKADEWNDVRCIINPCRYEIDGMPAMSWYYAHKADSDDNWTVSDIMYFAADKYASIENNGNDNRFYSDLGHSTIKTEEYIDIDDYALLPVVSVGEIKRETEYNSENDRISYMVKVKNNDPANERTVTIITAAYENGRLVGASPYEITLEPNEVNAVNAELFVSKQEADREVKCFIFDGFDTLRPLYTHFSGMDYR